MRSRRLLPALLALIGAAAHLLVAARTVAPDRDAASYLAMARAFRVGDWAKALGEVFPPLWPATWAAVGPVGGTDSLAWWHGAVLLGAVAAGIAVAATWVAARRWLGPIPALVGALWLGLSVEAARAGADGLSEALFPMLVALWLLAWTRPRGPSLVWTAVLAGLAFLCRPEGALLAVPPLLTALTCDRRGPALVRLLPGLVLPVGWLVLRAQATGTWSPLPVGAFMAGPVSVEGQPLSAFGEASLPAALGHVGYEALLFVGQGFEGLGWMALPLLPLGFLLLRRPELWRAEPDAEGRGPIALPRWTVVAPALVALAGLCVVPLFFAHRRFWVSWLPLLLPVAALPLATLRVRPPGQRLFALAFALSLVPSFVQLLPERRASIRAERELGLWLGSLPAGPPALVSDLKRLHFFAGTWPPPPRPVPGTELMSLAAAPEARFVVSYGPRPGRADDPRAKLDPEALEALGYRPAALPAPLDASVPQGNLRVYRR
ncbi:MAG: glycosyltransferase family 39 protein [Planctomycetota bacterium]